LFPAILIAIGNVWSTVMWGFGQQTLLGIVVGLCGASGNTLYGNVSLAAQRRWSPVFVFPTSSVTSCWGLNKEKSFP
jgi:hypothetical protein